MSPKTIQEVLEEHTAEWLAISGVVGTAIGEFEQRPCIKVFVVQKTAELAAKIPRTQDGHRVILEETGEFRAL